MQRGLVSLLIISATAPLIGFFGSVLGILNSFRSISGAPGYVIGFIAEYLSEAMLPALLGLFVALCAFWIHSYLTGRLEAFDLEMENASRDLLNRLARHLSGMTQREFPPRPIVRTIRVWSATAESLAPCLAVPRMFRHGVLQLVWPRLESRLEADSVLWGSARIVFLYGLLAWFAYYVRGRSTAGFLLVMFFSVAAMNIRIGSIGTIYGLFAYFVFACLACAISYGGSLSLCLLAAAPLLLIGSVKAASYLGARPAVPPILGEDRWRAQAKNKWERLQPLPNIFAGLLGASAATIVLFGTMLAFYSVGSDSSMEPTLHQGDYVISIGNVFSGPVKRGQVVNIANWRSVSPARVVGLPGDSVQVRSGQLVLNGRAVFEPYRSDVPYRGDVGDFPLPLGAVDAGNPSYPIEAMFSYEVAQRNRLDYVLPEHAYFVLNDDRNTFGDSREIGPVWDFQIAGRPIFAINTRRLSESPRFIR